MTRQEAIDKLKRLCSQEQMTALKVLVPELSESEDENLKNKSGYYKAGKFWKASTLWNAVKSKPPQRVPNRYILQECTWNISSLQRFADEVKNVQEVDLNYPIILDMNGNILDGAHRVVKAYLEGKDIDIVYLGDDEWPEPDYDEEKAVKESEDERIRKVISLALIASEDELSDFYKTHNITRKECTDWLEKQKENPDRLILIGKAKSEKQVVLLAESNGDENIYWDTKSEDDAVSLLEKGLKFFGKQKPDDVKREWWNKGYLEGRKNAHIPARELGLPSSWDFQKEQKPSEQKYEGEKLHNIVIAELGKYNGDNFFKAPWATDSTGLQYPLYFANLGAKWQKDQKPAEKLSKEDYVKKFKTLCDAYEIKLPNREYDIYHLCDDLSKLSIDSGEQNHAE